MIEIRVRGSLTCEDVRAALLLNWRLRVLAGRAIALLCVVVLLGAAIVAQSVAHPRPIPTALGLGFVLLPLLMICRPLLAARRQWRAMEHLRGPTEMTFTEAGVRGKSEKVNAEALWGAYVRAHIGTRVILLYLQVNLMEIIPRHFFQTEADGIAFERLLYQKLGAGSVGRAGGPPL